jgi:hypothetical protein
VCSRARVRACGFVAFADRTVMEHQERLGAGIRRILLLIYPKPDAFVVTVNKRVPCYNCNVKILGRLRSLSTV